MKSVQQLIKVPEVAATMRDLSKEMMRVLSTQKKVFFCNYIAYFYKQAGIIEEMLEDTLEGLDDADELEEEAQDEVDKV